MYITKKQLEKELQDTAKTFNKTKQFKPVLFILAAIGIVTTLIFVIPILIAWIFLWIIYIPLSIVDSVILKLWRKYNG